MAGDTLMPATIRPAAIDCRTLLNIATPLHSPGDAIAPCFRDREWRGEDDSWISDQVPVNGNDPTAQRPNDPTIQGKPVEQWGESEPTSLLVKFRPVFRTDSL